MLPEIHEPLIPIRLRKDRPQLLIHDSKEEITDNLFSNLNGVSKPKAKSSPVHVNELDLWLK